MIRSLPWWRAVVLVIGGWLCVMQPACDGCSERPRAAPSTPSATIKAPDSPGAVAPSKQVTATVVPVAPYRGPTAKNRGGFRVTTGFKGADGVMLSQPKALERFQVLTTALAPDEAPLGQLTTFRGAELHGFLLARDLRHAHYTSAIGTVAPNADARALSFEVREGGDHALVVVFSPPAGSPQAVAAPITVKGALPTIAGRGVAGQSDHCRVEGGDVVLSTGSAKPVVGAELVLATRQVTNTGVDKGPVQLPFWVALNDALGEAEIVLVNDVGLARWTPRAVGNWLLVSPPFAPKSKRPLTFKVTVQPKADAQEDTSR